MHAIKGGWVGQTFALAASDDSVSKKSRIRRSKEERKTMVESFIKKYQDSNNGNFPSLNLTHKEVGGSFYTVREIVREIIQENRVLGPPKFFSEEDSSGFLEHPLGSIALEPSVSSLSNKTHIMTHTMSDQNQITSGEHISTFSPKFDEPKPVDLDKKQMFNGLSKADEKDRYSPPSHCQDDNSHSSKEDEVLHFAEPSPQANNQMFVDGQTVSGGNTFEKSQECNTPVMINDNPIHQGTTGETFVLSSGTFPGPGLLKPSDEQTVNENHQINNKTKAVLYAENLEGEKKGAKELEVLQDVILPKKAKVVVESFSLRHVSKTILDMDGNHINLSAVTGSLEEKATQHATQHEKFKESLPALVNREVEEKLQSSESSDSSSTTKTPTLDVSIVKDVEAKDSLPDGNKPADDLTKQAILKEPTADARKPYLKDKSSFQKESNPQLDRINLETWEETSKKSSVPDRNPLLTLLKGFISAFVKLWME